MALRQIIAVVLVALGLGIAGHAVTPTVGMVTGGLVLATLSAAFLIDLDEEREP